jgi:hypothetical protein
VARKRHHAARRPLADYGPGVKFPTSKLISLRSFRRCTNLAFPGPLLAIDYVTNCWVARFRHAENDYLFFVGRNPRDHRKHTIIYALSDGGSSIVGIPGEHSDDYLTFTRFPIARIGFHRSRGVEYFDFATGRFTRAES